MNIIRFWPIPCLVFCLYCLYTLVADSYEVLYQKRSETNRLQFLVCLHLNDLYTGKTEIDLKQLGADLYDYFNTSWNYEGNRQFDRGQLELTLSRMRSGGYLVLNGRVCLIANDQQELIIIDSFLHHNFYGPVLFAIRNDTLDFVRMGSPHQQIDQLIVRKMGRPYSDCDENNRRFHCLNECFRRRFRLARYFYQVNETGRILLHFSECNRTIQESERFCFGQCKRENCKLFQLILGDRYKEPKTETFEAEPILSAFDFWLQIIGLFFSIVGLFFDQFASTTTKLTEKLTRSTVKRRKVKVGLFYLNLTIIIFTLAYLGYLCVRVALDQQTEANDLSEREKMRNLIHPKTVHLAICVDIDKYVDKIFEGKTMSEIESATDEALNETLEGIYVTYGGRSFRSGYQVHRKTLFKFEKRCFPLSIQPNYQTIPSRPILTVKFREKTLHEFYVLSKEENLNGKSFEYYQYAFKQRIVKRLKSKGRCVDYKTKYDEKKYGKCTGRQNCVERCIARKFLGRYNRTTFGRYPHPYPVIDRDWFSQSEWNTSKMMKIPEGNRSIYFNVSRECEEKFPDGKPCDEAEFEETVKIEPPDGLTMNIDLQFDIVRSVEELPSSLRMALDLLGIQTIFFGFTLLKLFWRVYLFVEPSWRLKHDKVVWFLVCLLASIGCSWTTVRMLDVIINGELVPTEHYEMAERIQMPAMVFCLPIEKLVNQSHQLTGSYLENLTMHITAESTFERIAYLNESNEWTPFDLRRVERFFLLDMKCFRVHIDQAYDRNQFHFSDDMQVLEVDFNKGEQNELVHFMTQSNVTGEFSKIRNLDYSDLRRYRIIHEASMYEYEDRFSLFRWRFPSLPEGDVGDLHGQLLELQSKEPKRRTLYLPLMEEHFKLKVDEDHFEQLYSAQQQKNRNKRANLNYRQVFVANHLTEDDIFETEFSLHLVLLRRVVRSTNEVNYATLTIGLLNLLSLWLELGVLDLRPFLVRLHKCLLDYLLRKLIMTLFFCCKRLKKLEAPPKNRIDPCLQDAPNYSEDLKANRFSDVNEGPAESSYPINQ